MKKGGPGGRPLHAVLFDPVVEVVFVLNGPIRQHFPVALQRDAQVAGHLDVSVDDDVAIFGVEFHGVAPAAGHFRGDQGAAAAAEEINDQVAGLAAVGDGRERYLDGFLRGVLGFGLPRYLPDGGLLVLRVQRDAAALDRKSVV